jgi:hypothetical protein
MRKGETKYKGKIMQLLSEKRWSHPRPLAFKEINEVLDDAKAEFDAIEKEFFPNGDIPHSISPEEAEIKYWVPRERKLQTWFKKWFGDN